MNRPLVNAEATLVEQRLETVIRKYGLKAIERELEGLVDKAGWSDWQHVWNLAKNINNKIKREKQQQ